MATLKRNSEVLTTELKIADNPWLRAKGLLGRESLPSDEVLWIKPCNNIHTFFMKFPIDVVFTDRNLKVVKVRRNVVPGRLILPVWRASNTFECAVGFLDRHQIREGDQLHVGS